MSLLAMVQYADVQGIGFRPYVPAGEAKADRGYWQLAEALLDGEVAQPREGLYTLPHPVWRLRLIRGGTSRYWCFTVQGRGGPYGAAGTCRFAFWPERDHPAEVWKEGWHRIASDHPGGVPAADQTWVRTALEPVLGALVTGQRRVRLPGTPAEAAGLIHAALRAVPEPASAGLLWSTCLLQLPEPGQAVLAPMWPDEFTDAVPKLGAQLSELLQPGPSAIFQKGADKQRRSALRWLINQAAAGYPPATSADTVLGRIDEIAMSQHLYAAENAPHLLGSKDGRAILVGQPALVREWVAANAQAAILALAGPMEAELGGIILYDLIAIQAATRQNILGVPTPQHLKPAQPDFGKLIARFEPDAPMRVDIIRRLSREAMLFGEPPDLAPLHDWLIGPVGLLPGDAHDLFPPRVPVLVRALRAKPPLSREHLDELRRAEEPWLALDRVVAEAGALSPAQAAHAIVVGVALEPGRPWADRVGGLAATLTQDIAEARSVDPVSWLADVATHLAAPRPTRGYRRPC